MIWERRLFILLTALLCLPVWLVSWFPSQDGPSHVYNARVLFDLLTNPHSVYDAWYSLTPGLTTNLTGHLLLGLLSTFLPPPLPEKIVVTLCIALFAAGMHYAAGAANGRGAFLAMMASPAAAGVFLHMGLYNFLLGVGLFCFACGFWFRRWGLFKPLEAMVFSALLVALFLSHVMAWLIAAVVMGVPALWMGVRRGSLIRYTAPALAAGLPSLLLFLVYAAHAHPQGQIGPLFPVRSVMDLLVDNPIVSFTTGEGWVFLTLMFLCIILTAMVLRAKLHSGYWTAFDWLAPLAAFLFVLFLAAPAGALGGAYLRPRLWLFSGLTLLLWLSGHRFHRRDRIILSGAGAVMTVWLAWSHWESYQALQPYLKDVAAARRIVPREGSVLGLRYSQKEPQLNQRPLAMRVDPFLHAGAYLPQIPGGVWLGNYEASTHHFPLTAREGLDANRLGNLDGEPPCLDLLSWQARTGRRIDYVMLAGYPSEQNAYGCAASTFRQLHVGYELLYESDSRFVRVYRLVQRNSPAPADGLHS